ncbi:MAG: DUF503 domain-containing protein [Deltaproteobacteria bacterium]|nr:DUF503 domain-containing protein [Deltaproteobacteria bacterium]
MRVGMLIVEFHLPGCHSLKEKRGRLVGLRDRFGKQTNVAVCESDFQNEHQRAEWSFVATGAERKVVEQTLRKIENHVETHVDAVVVNIQHDWI